MSWEPPPHARVGGSGLHREFMFRAMTAKNTTQNEEPHPALPSVYRDASCPERWLVEILPTAFMGPNAGQAALKFAHETYGCARYFGSSQDKPE